MANEDIFGSFDPYKNTNRRTVNRSFNAPGVESFLSDAGGGGGMLPPTRQEREARQYESQKRADEIARRAGYRPSLPGPTASGAEVNVPGGGRTYITGYTGGVPNYIRASSLGSMPLGGGGMGGDGDGLDRLLAMDAAQQQAEADAAFMRNQQEIDAMRGFVGGLDQRIMGQAKGLYGDLIGQADKLEKLGETQYQDVMKRMPGIEKGIGEAEDLMKQRMERADLDASRAYQKALEAEEYAKKTQQEYKDTSVMEASAAANGISRSFKQQENAISSGLRPDGTQMSPQEVFQAHQELSFQTKQEIQSQVTPILARHNEVYAQLGQFVTQTIMNSAQAAQNMAQQRAQIASAGLEGSLASAQSRTALMDRQLQAQQNQAQMSQLSAQLHRDATETAQAAMFRSAELTMQGMAKTAEMVTSNVRSLVSRFQGKLGLISARRAMGAGGGGAGALTATPGAPRTPFAAGGSMAGQLNFTRPQPTQRVETPAAQPTPKIPADELLPAQDPLATSEIGPDGQKMSDYLRDQVIAKRRAKTKARKDRERMRKMFDENLQTSGREDIPDLSTSRREDIPPDLSTSSREDIPDLSTSGRESIPGNFETSSMEDIPRPSKKRRRRYVLDDQELDRLAKQLGLYGKKSFYDSGLQPRFYDELNDALLRAEQEGRLGSDLEWLNRTPWYLQEFD